MINKYPVWHCILQIKDSHDHSGEPWVNGWIRVGVIMHRVEKQLEPATAYTHLNLEHLGWHQQNVEISPSKMSNRLALPHVASVKPLRFFFNTFATLQSCFMALQNQNHHGFGAKITKMSTSTAEGLKQQPISCRHLCHSLWPFWAPKRAVCCLCWYRYTPDI